MKENGDSGGELLGQGRKRGRVRLERIVGLTVSSNAALDCHPTTGLVAYPAGCTVVLLNPRKNKQSHLQNVTRKTITALSFSADGRYLATGECGHQPALRVWDLQERVQVAEFVGHKFGIVCVAFSPNHKYVVSVGSQHDMIVNVWDWRAGTKVASNKVSSKVKAVSFAENGSYFVTVGNRHVKFWYLEYSRSAKYKEPVPLMGRSAILGEQRNNYFCDVACGRGEMGDSTYAITKSGLLCEFNNRRLLDKWVELRTASANCLVVGEQFIFIGCADGIVRCFSPFTLQFVTTLPRTHYLGVDVGKGLSISHMASHPANARYPDTVAVTYDETNHKVTCVYSDRSLYVWDVHDIRKVGKSHSFLYHAACIWGVETYPTLREGMKGVLPAGSFVTCSSDDTIRVWNLDANMSTNTLYKRNIYSNELLKVLYVDPELTFLRDQDLAAGGSGDKTEGNYDGRNGVRCIKISPDGKHLASGDRAGNIRIHEIQFMDQLFKIEAHDAEVLCLEYTRLESGLRLLASASRDRLIHVFSVDEGYTFLQTLDDHSSSITAVRFLQIQGTTQMVSCAADKSVIFRQLQTSGPASSQPQFVRGRNIVGKTTLYDMEVDQSQKHILTACQDRSIRVYNTGTGKHSKTFRGAVAEDGTLIKLVLDNSGLYVATSCTDKTLCIYDYYSGECLATMYGHSELVTGLRFTPDSKHLISVSGDGCMFIWRVPHEMTVTMQARLAQQVARQAKDSRIGYTSPRQEVKTDSEEFGSPPRELLDPNANADDMIDYRFSVGKLPLWAKKQITDVKDSKSQASSHQGKNVDFPKGRWAQRVDTSGPGITVKSFYQGDSVIPFPPGQGADKLLADSDGSKDSSLESTESRTYGEFRLQVKEGPVSRITRRGGESSAESGRGRTLTDDSSASSLKMEDFEGTEHDGDVEDYSDNDGNSTEPEHHDRLLYYPQNDDGSSDYTVNAMDVEELRRSQRRLKKGRSHDLGLPLHLNLQSTVSVSGSQDSDDDDEEVSTPSGDLPERNFTSAMSGSTESLERVGRRETFLKSTFESLGGTDALSLNGSPPPGDKDDNGKASLSSRFLRTSPASHNVEVINAAKATQKDPEAAKKREELQKRIEETRRKLQSIGYKSTLKSSQSISDLSRAPDSETEMHSLSPSMRFGSSVGGGAGSSRPTNGTTGSISGDTEDEGENRDNGGLNTSGGMRRACSLSDLTQPSPSRRLLPNPPNNVSGKVAPRTSAASSSTSSTTSNRISMSRLSSKSTIDLSRSSTAFNQNESESGESRVVRSSTHGRINSLARSSTNTSLARVGVVPSQPASAMRPTISSSNKAAVSKPSSSSGSNRATPRRMTGAVSTGDILQAVHDESSSDGEPERTNVRARVMNFERSVTKSQSTNAMVSGRRTPSTGLSTRTTSEKDLRKSTPSIAGVASPSPKADSSTKRLPLDSSGIARQLQFNSQDAKDPNRGPLCRASCEMAVETFKSAADSLLVLQRRLSGGSSAQDTESNLSDRERSELLHYLSSSIAPILQKLKPLHAISDQEGVQNAASEPIHNNVLIPPEMAAANNPLMVQMMQQYSDMLLNMFQQRMQTNSGSSN